MTLYLWFAIAGFKYPCFVVLLETMGPFLPVGNLYQAVKGFYPAGERKLWVLFRLGSPRMVPSRLLRGLAPRLPGVYPAGGRVLVLFCLGSKMC